MRPRLIAAENLCAVDAYGRAALASMRPRLIAAENSLPASRYLKRISEVIHERCLSSATWEAADEPSTRLIKLANP